MTLLQREMSEKCDWPQKCEEEEKKRNPTNGGEEAEISMKIR